MYNEQIEALISAALADGMLTEKEKQILFKKAQSMGIDLDEFEMVLDARLVELEKAEKTKAAPKSNKYGDVRKCPICGAMVPALGGACPECGYEFSGVDANLSSQKLAELLLQQEQEFHKELDLGMEKLDANLEKYRKVCGEIGADAFTVAMDSNESHWKREKAQTVKDFRPASIERKKHKLTIELRKKYQRSKCAIISNFPIPNTKADLFEFITSLTPKIDEKELGKAYQTKLEECVIKTQTLFPNDDVFVKLLTDYRKAQQQRKKRLIVLISIVSIVVLLCTVSIIIIAKKYRVLHNGDVCVEAIQQAIANENYDKAYKLATQFKDRATEIHHGELALVQVYLDMGEFEKAKELVHICERNGNYYPSSKKPLGIYLIALGKYAEAEEYMNCKYWEDCGEYIYLCVENMCKIGQTKEARTFYNRKIKQYAHLYDNRQIRKQELSKKVNNLIASYNR